VRLPYIRVEAGEFEGSGKNPDDAGWPAVQLDGLADCTGRAMKTRFPESVTDHDKRLPLLGFLGRKEPPDSRLQA
jgi:hypothetical protein